MRFSKNNFGHIKLFSIKMIMQPEDKKSMWKLANSTRKPPCEIACSKSFHCKLWHIDIIQTPEREDSHLFRTDLLVLYSEFPSKYKRK